MQIKIAQEIQVRLLQQFSLTKPLALQNLVLIGCCEEHNDFYTDYYTMTWLDLGNALLQPEQSGLDSTDFVGIHPLAFHYFTPGILWAITESLLHYHEIIDPLWSWLRDLHCEKSRKPTYLHKMMEYYTDGQKELVAKGLELANERHLLINEYRDPDIDWSLTAIWAA